MDNLFEIPRCNFAVGDRGSFSIETLLPPIEKHKVPKGPSSVLAITDGWFTMFVNGSNVFRTSENPVIPEADIDYCRLSLSMFLEWIYFDTAYDLSARNSCFSDIVAGESSPAIVFKRMGNEVEIKWDLTGWSRNGASYVNPLGHNRILYHDYLIMLAVAADSLIAITELRAFSSGRQEDWHEWLAGYRSERNKFQTFLKTELIG